VSGSFKGRGAAYQLVSAPVPEAGVVAASGGNHGCAVAWAAQRLGVKATIFVPEISAPAKVARLRAYGADVVVGGAAYADALAASEEFVSSTGARAVHAYDQEATVLGAGTCAKDLDWQAPELGSVVVAVGGGGLLAGTLGYYREDAAVYGVEPRLAPSLHAALEAGEPVDVEVGGIAADSLGAKRIGSHGYALAKRFAADVVLVEDEDIVDAQRALWDELRLAVEPAAAAGLAALRAGRLEVEAPVALIVCGANLDPATLAG
jgi:threonine dehydratase